MSKELQLTIREFAPGEWRLYRDLRLRALQDAPDAFSSTYARESERSDDDWAARLARGASAPGDLPLVAEADGDPCGLAWVRIEEATRDVARLYQMWVAPEFRRRGIGRALVAEAIRWARSAGAHTLALDVTTLNASAVRLYERSGFVAAGPPTPLRPGAALHCQAMQRALYSGSDLDIMRLHVEAEFTHDAAGDLVSTNEPAAQAAPRFFLGQTAIGHVVRFRRDVSASRRRALENAVTVALREPGMTRLEQPLDPLPFERILSEDAPIQHTSVGLAFRFPRSLNPAAGTRILHDPADAALLHPLLAPWAPDIEASPPLVAFVADGQAVAVCASVRIAPQAREAGVETAAPFRGRGYGSAVVAAWGTAVRALGVEPLYSTTWQNNASRALAHTLGLVPIGRDLHIR